MSVSVSVSVSVTALVVKSVLHAGNGLTMFQVERGPVSVRE